MRNKLLAVLAVVVLAGCAGKSLEEKCIKKMPPRGSFTICPDDK